MNTWQGKKKSQVSWPEICPHSYEECCVIFLYVPSIRGYELNKALLEERYENSLSKRNV